MIKVCTETFKYKNPSSIETYLKCGGYTAWKDILKHKTPKSEVISIIKESQLKGKGGAGFLTGLNGLLFLLALIKSISYVILMRVNLEHAKTEIFSDIIHMLL